MGPEEKARDYLATSHLYQLGSLPTEMPHPETTDLSHWAKTDLPRALRALEKIDDRIFELVKLKAKEGLALSRDIRKVLGQGRKVFFSGCGATGRLALTLESLWRESHELTPLEDSVIGFMAGGDVAVVRSVEHFEDHPEYGAKHLKELGFSEGDLLIAVTEGGETPYVIGTVEEALILSFTTKPWFIFCNPAELLIREVERSKKIILDPRVHSMELLTGPMALSGSTRLQATSAQILVTAIALLYAVDSEKEWADCVSSIQTYCSKNQGNWLISFIESEAAVYESGYGVLYHTNAYGITLLTDTTERSPTFSIAPFQNVLDHGSDVPDSIAHLKIDGAKDSDSAWRKILGRTPRGLDWKLDAEMDPEKLGVKRILGFDFSQTTGHDEKEFLIARGTHAMKWEFPSRGVRHEVPLPKHDSFSDTTFPEHLFLKLQLNRLSLLVMAKLGRVEGNLMTWVRPSNGKLVDRSIRYARTIYGIRNPEKALPSYQDTAHALFHALEHLAEGEPVVLKTLEFLEGKK